VPGGWGLRELRVEELEVFIDLLDLGLEVDDSGIAEVAEVVDAVGVAGDEVDDGLGQLPLCLLGLSSIFQLYVSYFGLMEL
jgi:hypothetical protein